MDFAPTKSPDSDNETPLQTHHPTTRTLSFTNGTLKLYAHHHPPPPQMVVSYKECLRNHAASLGGLALDGCGEFMPSPTSTPLDPTSLTCAACGCHRNFHRLHHLHHPPPAHHWNSSPSPNQTSPGPSSASPTSPPSPPAPIPQSCHYSAPHMLLALSTGCTEPLDEQNHPSFNPTVMKKRTRTKFTQDQKEKMFQFAEKMGWKLHRGGDNERMIEEFCSAVGVRRRVLKVWMHNNKQTLGKKENMGVIHGHNSNINGKDDVNGNGEDRKVFSFDTNAYNNNSSNMNSSSKNGRCNNGDGHGSSVHVHGSTNASSSSG